LLHPPRQPEYRKHREHAEFIVNLPIGRQKLVEALGAAWPAQGELKNVPLARAHELVASKFSQREWNFELP
jgi:hypothetical protein